MARALLLTGRPGVGKTTAIHQALAGLHDVRAGGFYTQEVRHQGHRTGFRLVDLDGPAGMLASVNTSGRYRVGKYRVHLDDLERIGVAALRRAIADPGVSLLVVDEIGKMELFSSAFRAAVLAALESPKPLLGTVMLGTHPWVEAIKARPDVTVVEVTPANRQVMPRRILRWWRQESGGEAPA